MAWQLKGSVSKCDHREYGFAQLQVLSLGESNSVDALFEGLGTDMQAGPSSLIVSLISNNRE